jgi:hypothetical protein
MIGKFIIFVFLASTTFACKAQIINRYDVQVSIGEINGAYYKDVNDFRNRFLGTWVFTNGNTSLIVVFQKRDSLFTDNGFKTYYEDVLIGEYKFVENGIEKINTIDNLNVNYGFNLIDNSNKHNLFGDFYLRYPDSKPECLECLPNEKRMVFSLTEPNYDGLGVANNRFVVRYFVESGVEKIKVWFYDLNQIVKTDQQGNEILPAPYKLPFGEYILIKQ